MAYTIIEEGIENHYYIKLESEHDSQLNIAVVDSIGVVESIGAGSPYLTISLQDGLGDLINNTYISPDAAYTLSLGRTALSSVSSDFSLASVQAATITPGKTESVGMQIDFMSSNWPFLMKDTHSRSWGNVRISDVVQNIASEVGFYASEVEQTSGFVSVLQPDWTNMRLLRWLAMNAVNKDGLGGYEFLGTSDGRFIFKTFESLFSQKPKRRLVLSQSEKDDPTFGTFSIRQDYAGVLSRGGFGLNYGYFDYNTKQFVDGKARISDMNTRQISDWYFISKQHETASRRFWGGRNPGTKHVAETRVLDVANAAQTIDVTIQGDVLLHAGDIVDIFIPPSEFHTNIVNERYSGYWMIRKVVHQVSIRNRFFFSHLTLCRPGINGVTLDGLVQSRRGKVLG